MSAICFVDTNLLVYFHDASSPEKQRRARDWMELLWKRRAGRLSYQVLSEFYLTVTRKLDPGLDEQEARRSIRDLVSWQPRVVDDRALEAAWSLQDRHSLSWWDALIVASAQLAGCTHLLSEEIRPARSIAGLELVDPFSLEPAEMLSSGQASSAGR